MNSTYYLVRILASADLPQAVNDFLLKQSSFHQLDKRDFIFAAPTGQAASFRDQLNSLLGSTGTAEVNAISFHSRP